MKFNISKMYNSLSRCPNHSEIPERIYLRCLNDSRDELNKRQQKLGDRLNRRYWKWTGRCIGLTFEHWMLKYSLRQPTGWTEGIKALSVGACWCIGRCNAETSEEPKWRRLKRRCINEVSVQWPSHCLESLFRLLKRTLPGGGGVRLNRHFVVFS